MKPYIRDLLILLLIIICIQIKCNWQKEGVRENRTTDTTLYIGKTFDSIRVDTFTKEIPKPYPVYVYLAAKDSNSSISSSLELCDSIRLYTESLDDSSGLVVVESKVQGELIDQKITLQSYVTSTFRVDTLKITNTIVKEKALFAPFLRVQNSPTPLSGGLIWGNSRTFYGVSYGGKQNFGVIFGYNLAKK